MAQPNKTHARWQSKSTDTLTRNLAGLFCLCPLPQRTEILIAYRERDHAEAAWFERAARTFTISTEPLHPHWQHAITFQSVAQPDGVAGFAPPSASVAATAPISAALKYQHEYRPLSILRLQKKKAQQQTDAIGSSAMSQR